METLQAIARGEPLITAAGSAPTIFWECPIFCARYEVDTSHNIKAAAAEEGSQGDDYHSVQNSKAQPTSHAHLLDL
jgi:hypothetical protein